jgi:hypothetical protein
MKSYTRTFCVIIAGLLLGLPKLHAQPYTIDWHRISGGGTSAGTNGSSVYSVSGTIGQSDAGATMTDGSFSVTGGFWSLIAIVQTIGSPTLTILHSGNSVLVSWPSPSTGFLLQQNSNLTAANWMTSGFTISDDGTNKSITINPPTGNLFFRLKQ